MSTDDLRAAAERVAEYTRIASQGTPGQAPAYRDAAYMAVYNGTPHSHLQDTRRLALAALGEPDDEEPVTADWLRSIGFQPRGRDELISAGCPGSPWRLVYDTDPGPNWPRWSVSFPGVQAGLGYDLTTRGQVRTLLNVLRIPPGAA